MNEYQQILQKELEEHEATARQAFPGPNYLEWMQWFHKRLQPGCYCEIGIAKGMTLALAHPTSLAIGIDPNFLINRGIEARCQLFRMTSDEFFSRGHAAEVFSCQKVDLGFIDGLHIFDQVLQDFFHLERFMNRGGMIVLHDVLPINAEVANRERKTRFWTGDVFKALLLLREMRPDLNICLLPTYPSGLALITNLKPEYNYTESDYAAVMERFHGMDFNSAMTEMALNVFFLSNNYDTVTEYLFADNQESSLLKFNGESPRVGVMTPTFGRPDMIRFLVAQMALQKRVPDVLCIHENGLDKSYRWAVEDYIRELGISMVIDWIYSPRKLCRDEWYLVPLDSLLHQHRCDIIFWCDHDDFYRVDHIANGVRLLTETENPPDFSINSKIDLLIVGGVSIYEYLPGVIFTAHAPGGMSSSMCFNSSFGKQLLEDLKTNNQSRICRSPHLPHSDQVVKNVTMPKFRCIVFDERPTTVYHCHEGTVSSSHWIAKTSYSPQTNITSIDKEDIPSAVVTQ